MAAAPPPQAPRQQRDHAAHASKKRSKQLRRKPQAPPTPPRMAPPPPLPLAERLNARFLHGSPSNSLESAGVLLHVFDKTEDSKHAFLPSTHGWSAAFGGRLSASMINAGQPGTWSGAASGGLIFSPVHAQILCAYGEEYSPARPAQPR